MKFDEIIVNHLGGFGRYQKWQYVLVGLPTIFTALHSLSWTFTGAKMKHRCLYPGENASTPYKVNDSWHTTIANLTAAADKDGCKRIAGLHLWQPPPPLGQFSMQQCPTENSGGGGFAWDRDGEMSFSAVARWTLVCSREVLRAVIQCMYYIGQFFGSLVFGILSDKFGRKPIFLIAILLQVVCGSLMAWVPHWGAYAPLRVGVGFAHPGIFVMAVVIGAELVAPKYRVVSSVGAGFFFAIGEILLGALAYPLRDYRYLQLAISVPAVIFFAYWWLVPESPRWLMSRGRYADADRILQKAAKCNRQPPLPQDWYAHLDQDQQAKTTLTSTQAMLALFRTPNLRKRTLITFVIWPVVSMCFYGLAINPALLGGDNRLGFIIGGALEIPALMVILFGLNTIGRKYLTSFGFILATVCLLLTRAVPEDKAIYREILVVIGKSSLTAVYATVYIMTPEHYPTMIRNTATGSCSMIARAGGVAASFMSMYLAETEPVVVTLVFAALTTVAGLLALLLPETTGEPLMETLEEAEMFGVGQPIFISGRKNMELVKQRFGSDQPKD